MSRNEVFLFLACAFAAAIMAGPTSRSHAPHVSLAGMFSSASAGGMAGQDLLPHGFDH